MLCNFVLTKFETRAERPLFTGDCAAYRLTVPLPAEESGLLTVAAYRPDTENPVLVSEAFSGTVASATLAAGQYDKEGETRFLCTVSDENGGVLTTRLLYATVLRGIAQGTPAPDDKTALSELLSEAGKAVSECSAAASSATEAAAEAREAAALVVKVPTKVSQLENDEKYIKNTGTDIDEERRVVKIGDSGLYDLALEAYEVHINSESSGYVAITNLQDPASDRDAATKKYVDDKLSAKNPYTLIEEITVSEDTTSIERNAEPNGTAYAFTDVYYEIETVKGSGTGTILVSCNGNLTCGQHACIVTSAGRFASGFIKIEHGFLTTEFVNFATKIDTVANKVSRPLMVLSKEAEKITQLRFHVTGVPTLIPIPAGTKIRIYGVRI